MSGRDYIPKRDTDLQLWMEPFSSIMGTNLTTLGLLSGDYTAISTLKSNFDAAMTDFEMKRDAASAATQAKDAARASLVAKARELAQKIQKNVSVSESLKASMGLTVAGSHPPPAAVPFPPIDLVYDVLQPGAYQLKWKANGNASGTLYSLEARYGTATTFVSVVTITKTKFIHDNQPPNQKVAYRVRAQHGTLFSLPSNIVIINDAVGAASPV
ncbi:MAG: hypothetical protein NT007_06130 [Candidatus Kapabacteria bacterium]|nr:hypothetical protein [Candidatus Kapabacteria bacterium]